MEERIKNILTQEKNFNELSVIIEDLNEILNKWETMTTKLESLMSYYESEQWYLDYEASNNGGFKDISCGVLSQDAIYDLYHSQRKTNLKMIRTALKFLES